MKTAGRTNVDILIKKRGREEKLLNFYSNSPGIALICAGWDNIFHFVGT